MAIDLNHIRLFLDGESITASVFNRPIVDLINEIDNSFLSLDGGTVNGDVVITGNLTVRGQTVQVDNRIETGDTLIVLNDGEVGAGVTAGFSGIQVDRGTENDYQFGFNESSGFFELGEIGNRQAVATRETTPLNNGFAIWDNTTNKFVTKNASDSRIAISLSSTDDVEFRDIIGRNIDATGYLRGSDPTLKYRRQVVSDITREDLDSIALYYFCWKDMREVSETIRGTEDIGIMADEVQKIFPECVTIRSNGILAVDYAKFATCFILADYKLRREGK